MPKKKLTIDEVSHVAKLANLPLSQSEIKKFAQQLSETVAYVGALREVDTKNVPPTSQVTGKVNEFRQDQITSCLSKAQALKNAARTHEGFFVAKIVWD